MFCCCLRGVCQVASLSWTEWFPRTYRVPFHTSICEPVGEKRQLCCCASGSAFLPCHRPPAATTIASTLLRTSTAVFPHSLESFNYQASLMDPLSRSQAKRSKTAEVVVNISCERSIFPEIHICKLCVIPRSRVLRRVQF